MSRNHFRLRSGAKAEIHDAKRHRAGGALARRYRRAFDWRHREAPPLKAIGGQCAGNAMAHGPSVAIGFRRGLATRPYRLRSFLSDAAMARHLKQAKWRAKIREYWRIYRPKRRLGACNIGTDKRFDASCIAESLKQTAWLGNVMNKILRPVSSNGRGIHVMTSARWPPLAQPFAVALNLTEASR